MGVAEGGAQWHAIRHSLHHTLLALRESIVWEAGEIIITQFVLHKEHFQATNAFLERLCNRRCDHELYGLKPQHHFDAAHPTLNDPLPNLLCSGQVIVKVSVFMRFRTGKSLRAQGDVKSFTEDSVIFEDGTSSKTDLVILATGYTYAYAFMQPQSLIPINVIIC